MMNLAEGLPFSTRFEVVLDQLRSALESGAPAPAVVRLIEELFVRIGRDHRPAMLFELDSWGCFDGSRAMDELAAALRSAWVGHEVPEQAVERDWWIRMFMRSGFQRDGIRTDRPSRPVRLYRGASPGFERGMAWTSDPDVAQHFAAGGLRGRAPGSVWTTDVEPEALLAHFNDRRESEYVVDPDRLGAIHLMTSLV